jgi:hypothetical protein
VEKYRHQQYSTAVERDTETSTTIESYRHQHSNRQIQTPAQQLRNTDSGTAVERYIHQKSSREIQAQAQ